MYEDIQRRTTDHGQLTTNDGHPIQMIPLTLRQVRHAVGGKALNMVADENLSITAVCLDSRAMEAGALFIAIRGETFDGHDFLKQAAAGGAAAMLVHVPPADPPAGTPLIH